MKKTVVALVLAIVLLLTFEFGIANRANANFMGPALPNIYIKQDGSIEPSTAPIQRNGNTYSLTDNITNYAIIIQCDNIIVDGKGFTLQGRPSASIDWAITLEQAAMSVGRHNITIKNFNIKQFYMGIYAPFMSNSIITANTINCLNAVNLSPNCSNNQITNNKLISSDQDGGGGVWIWGSSNIITGNYIAKFHGGIEFYEGEHNIASDNVLINTTLNILTHHATDTILENNTINGESISSPSPKPTPSTISSDYWLNPTFLTATLSTVATVTVVSLMVCFKRQRRKG